jgi:hypothetical protein
MPIPPFPADPPCCPVCDEPLTRYDDPGATGRPDFFCASCDRFALAVPAETFALPLLSLD